LSRTQLYFTQQYSRDTTTCFGPICGPSSGWDLTFQGPLYKMCGEFFGGIGGWVGGVRSRCFSSGYRDLGLLQVDCH